MERSKMTIGIRRCIPGRMTRIKDVLALAAGEMILWGISLLCYDDAGWILPLQILIFPGVFVYRKNKRDRRRLQYESGFRELLKSLMISVQAGYSMENACRMALAELTDLYGDRKNPTVKQLGKIAAGLELQIPLEQLFDAYAKEAGHEDIHEFAAVLHITRSTGGNLVETVRDAMAHLQQKMDTAAEIQVILSGKLLEKNIMLSMPFVVLAYLRVTNKEYISCFYHSVSGEVLMSAIIIIVILCFFWTENIVRIEL